MRKISVILIFSATAGLVFSQNSAPSSHMHANDTASGDILMKTVRACITHDATYFCTMQWNAGQEGGAYCGFQDSPDRGHVFIYSIWDPTNRQPITAAFTGPGTVVERFGGEGTGLKSMNKEIGWDLHEWNTVVTRRWDIGAHTYFGFWIRRDSHDQWYHMVTMDYPVSDVTFNGSTNAFLEDWLSHGANVRRFEFKNGFKRCTDGTWLPMSQGTFRRNDEARSARYTQAVDAGVNDDVYFMQSGGDTQPSYAMNVPQTFQGDTHTTPPTPPVAFTIKSLTRSQVTWEVPHSSTPQFKYTIKQNDKVIISAIATETRGITLNASIGDRIEVTLEDILGRTTRQTKTIQKRHRGGHVQHLGHLNLDGSKATLSRVAIEKKRSFVVNSSTVEDKSHPGGVTTRPAKQIEIKLSTNQTRLTSLMGRGLVRTSDILNLGKREDVDVDISGYDYLNPVDWNAVIARHQALSNGIRSCDLLFAAYAWRQRQLFLQAYEQSSIHVWRATCDIRYLWDTQKEALVLDFSDGSRTVELYLPPISAVSK